MGAEHDSKFTESGWGAFAPQTPQKPVHSNQNSEPSTQNLREKTWKQPHTETQ